MSKERDRLYKTMNPYFDLCGSEITRIGKYYLVSRIARFGNYGGGPGFKFLMIAFTAHYLGKPLGWLLIFFEDQIRMLIGKLRSRRV